MFSNPTQLSLSDHQKWHLTPFQEWRWGKWAASMVVGKWMGWSERSQIKLGSCWVELHWRVSTGPHWTPWAHTVPPFPEHLTRMKVSHVDYDSVMPPFQHFIRLSVLSFYLLNTARTESVTEDDTFKPFLGFRIFSTLYHLSWNPSVQISNTPF